MTYAEYTKQREKLLNELNALTDANAPDNEWNAKKDEINTLDLKFDAQCERQAEARQQEETSFHSMRLFVFSLANVLTFFIISKFYGSIVLLHEGIIRYIFLVAFLCGKVFRRLQCVASLVAPRCAGCRTTVRSSSMHVYGRILGWGRGRSEKLQR